MSLALDFTLDIESCVESRVKSCKRRVRIEYEDSCEAVLSIMRTLYVGLNATKVQNCFFAFARKLKRRLDNNIKNARGAHSGLNSSNPAWNKNAVQCFHKSGDNNSKQKGYILHFHRWLRKSKELIIRKEIRDKSIALFVKGNQQRTSLKAEATRARGGSRKWILAFIHVSGWAGRHILVDGRLLLIPGNAHARALSKGEVELSTENTSSTSGCGLAELLQRRPLFSNNHLDDEVVLNAHSVLAVHIAKRLQTNVAGGIELDINLAALEVCLPTSLDFLVGNRANIFMKNTLALATNLAHMFGASRGNELLGFLDAPVELAQPPAGLRVRLVLDNARQAHLNGEIANGVDHRRELHRSSQVCGRENANGVLLVSRENGTPDVNGAPVGNLLTVVGSSNGRKIVVEGCEAAVGGGRQVTW